MEHRVFVSVRGVVWVVEDDLSEACDLTFELIWSAVRDPRVDEEICLGERFADLLAVLKSLFESVARDQVDGVRLKLARIFDMPIAGDLPSEVLLTRGFWRVRTQQK